MPIYEYRCESCQDEIEVLQRLDEPPRRKCGECGGRLRKLISRTSFQLKGSGWYAHGYGDKPASSNGSGSRRKSRRASAKPGDSTAAPSSKPASASDDSSKKTAGDNK